MPWLKSGSCAHCGACCKPPIVVDNPCFAEGDTECLFWTDDMDTGDLYGHCRIYQRPGNKMNTVDKHGVKIVQAQYDWWQANCQQYPVLIHHVPTEFGGDGAELPSTCAITIEYVP